MIIVLTIALVGCFTMLGLAKVGSLVLVAAATG
jgi:hypothetical protein